jgi:hypothetical protein
MAAFICQTTLEEKDNVLSVMRIVDRFTVQKPPRWDGKTNIQLPLQGLIAFKSGDVRGERKMRIFGVSPRGKRKKIFETPLEFAGGDTGVNLRLHITFGFKTPGTHWMDVYVDNWLATRIPLTILLEEEPGTQPPAEQGGSSK